MKKLLAILLCGIMIIGAIPMNVKAKTMDSELEQAIREVKSKVDIPSSYSSFDYYFRTPQSYADSYVELSWSNPKDNSYIQVGCDKDNHIINYYKRDNDDKSSSVPKYLKNELKTTADDFIKKIAPEISSKLNYLKTNSTNGYNGSYQYDYQRLENGIPFPDNFVSITVDSKTGKVRSANICWLYDTTVPSAKTELSLEEATKQIRSNLKMKLSYESNYYDIYSGNNIQKAYLIYQPDKEYVAIDAKSKKTYTTKLDTIIGSESGNTSADEATADATKGDSGVTLTEEEVKEIDVLKNLITKEAAIKAVKNNKYLLIDKNMTKVNASLNKMTDISGKSNYVWSVVMNDPREVGKKDADTYRAYAYAQVNAKTGKIMSFQTSMKDYYNVKEGKWNTVKIKYKEDDCQKILEKFLKSEMSSKFKNTKLADHSFDYIAYYTKKEEPVYGGYYYRYVRINEGVEYDNNRINGSVDGITGKIYSFGSYWNEDVVFESTSGIISKSQALDYYLKVEDGIHLVYEINQVDKYDSKAVEASSKYEIRLVYRTDISPSYISPFNGKQLNHDGSVYTKSKSYNYLDIDNSEQYRAVLLLSDMNVGFEGDYFYPNKEIQMGELDNILNGIGSRSAFETEGSGSTSLITREEMAYYFIKCLGLEKVSSIQGVYATGYNDQNSIDSRYLGAVALAKGLGIITGDSSNNFNPKKNVTRLDAVNMIMNFIKVQNEGNY